MIPRRTPVSRASAVKHTAGRREKEEKEEYEEKEGKEEKEDRAGIKRR